MRKTILTITAFISVCFLFTWILASCKKEQPPKNLTKLKQEIPASFPSPHYTFSDNPLTEEGFQLGRKLFYDGRLSIDNEHACSSCHQQVGAFGTFEHDRSHGVHDTHTLRNAPGLFNLAWNTGFHWDGEFNTLIDEAVHPINGNTEMGESFDGVIKKLQADPEYRETFKEVFGYPFIRPEYILKALAQFTGSIISANSKYDRVKKGTDSFFPPEESGYQLFKTYCAGCHPEPLFTDFSIRNNGLTLDNFLKDFGRMRITGRKEDSLKFKVPSLRNVILSSNYMHDGRFGTVAQCVNHYRTGVQASTTLDPLLSGGIILTNAQANDIVSFLRTLSDSSILTNPRYSNPE